MAVPAIHPGEHIAEELMVLDMSVVAFGGRLKLPAKRITGILDGHVAINRSVALRLACFFETSAEFWLNLQSLYELRLAEKNRRWNRCSASGQDVPHGLTERGKRK